MLKKFSQDNDELDRIQLVTADSELEKTLRQTLSHSPRFELELVKGSIIEAEKQGLGNAHPALLVVDLDPQDAGDLNALERVMSQRTGGLPVIVISDNLSETSARDFMRLNISDWCPKPNVEKRSAAGLRACAAFPAGAEQGLKKPRFMLSCPPWAESATQPLPFRAPF